MALLWWTGVAVVTMALPGVAVVAMALSVVAVVTMVLLWWPWC